MVESLLSIPTPTPRALPIDRPTPSERDPTFARATSDGLERARITDVSDFRRERFGIDELGRVERFAQVDQFAPPPTGVARDFFARPLVAEFQPGPRDFPANDAVERQYDRRGLPPSARGEGELTGSVIDPSFFNQLPTDATVRVELGPSPATLPDVEGGAVNSLIDVDPRSELGTLQDSRQAIVANLNRGDVADTVISFDQAGSQPVFNELRAGVFDGCVDFAALANRAPDTVQAQSAGVPVAADTVNNPAAAIDRNLETDIGEFNVDTLSNVRNADPRRETAFLEEAFVRTDEIPGAIRREPVVPVNDTLDPLTPQNFETDRQREVLREPGVNESQAQRAFEPDRGVVPGSIPLIAADAGRLTTSGAN